MARLQDVLIYGLRADQPLATTVSPGTVYSVSDEGNIQEQSDGTNWIPYGGSGGGGGGGLTQLTGDVVAGPGSGSQVATIQPAVVTNAKLATMAAATIKGRAVGGGTGVPVDLTSPQATAILAVVVGDTGTGGTKGLVPAPAAGDAAAGKFLKADGTFQVPAGGSGGSGITQLTGDVAAGPGSGVQGATIQPDVVTNTQLANMVANTIKGRAVGVGTGDPTDLTGAQATAILTIVAGDTGAGGTKGLVPAPGAGDAAAGKFLKADGTFQVPPASGITQLTGDVLAGPGSGSQVATIAPGIIQDPMLANMPESTIKGRQAGAGTGAPQNLTATQATAILNPFTGDSGAGGVKGMVPVPAAGDGAAGKVLAATGGWVVPAGGAGSGNPIGTMLIWPGPTAPTDYVFCDGTLLDKTAFAALYAALGGASSPWGQNATHFNVPDMRDRVPMGALSFLRGTYGGAVNHTHAAPAHSHAAGSLAAASHTHDGSSLAAASHTHGAGSLAVGSHTHPAGSLVTGSHAHGGGTLVSDGHQHTFGVSIDPGGLHAHGVVGAIDFGGIHSHTVNLNNVGGADTGSGINLVRPGTYTTDQPAGDHNHNINLPTTEGGEHTHSGGGITAPGGGGSVTGSTAAAAPGVTGDTGAAAPGVGGATAGSGAIGVSGSTGAAAPGVTGATAVDGATTTGAANQAFAAVNYIIKAA